MASYASSNSGASKQFALGAGSVGCTVTGGGVVSITGAAVGSDFCVITVSQVETANYLAGGPIPQSFHIAKAASGLAFDLSTLPAKTFGDGDFGVASYASSNSGASKQFALGAGSVGCTVTGGGVVSRSPARLFWLDFM